MNCKRQPTRGRCCHTRALTMEGRILVPEELLLEKSLNGMLHMKKNNSDFSPTLTEAI